MSPHKRKKLSKIRSELDKLDNTLIKVIKKRTTLVNKVLALKDKKNQIVDPVSYTHLTLPTTPYV